MAIEMAQNVAAFAQKQAQEAEAKAQQEAAARQLWEKRVANIEAEAKFALNAAQLQIELLQKAKEEAEARTREEIALKEAAEKRASVAVKAEQDLERTLDLKTVTFKQQASQKITQFDESDDGLKTISTETIFNSDPKGAFGKSDAWDPELELIEPSYPEDGVDDETDSAIESLFDY